MLERLVPSTFPFERVAFVCHQHFLPSVVGLFGFLASRDAVPIIWALGKGYSTVQGVMQDLSALGVKVCEGTCAGKPGHYAEWQSHEASRFWENVLRAMHDGHQRKRIVVIDEGGGLTRSIPNQLRSMACAVEQTRSGVCGRPLVPTIAVATCRAKRLLETPAIVEAILGRIRDEVAGYNGARIGVIGTGALGGALAKAFVAEGLPVAIHDAHRFGDGLGECEKHDSVASLLRNADLVIGCSGTDVLSLEDLPAHEVTLISASSADTEFRTLLRSCEWQRISSNSGRHDTLRRGRCTVLNGGFPFNFDGRTEREPPEHMALTRALMAAGVVQALSAGLPDAGRSPAYIDLESAVQREVALRWTEEFGLVNPRTIAALWPREADG